MSGTPIADAPRRGPGGAAATRRCALLVVLLALAVRLGALGVLGDPTGFALAEASPRGTSWEWGHEQGGIALALVDGRGYADPFVRGSGATAWTTPAYPLLLAALIEASGGIDRGVALSVALLQALASSLVCLFVWRLGRALHSERVGRLAALGWALHPLAAYLAVALVWDSTFIALGLTWYLARLAELAPRAAPRVAAGFGAALGAILLVNPAPVSLAPLAAVWLARGHERRDQVRVVATFALAVAAVLAPWSLRNLRDLGTPAVRTNLGVELFVGNNDGAEGPFNGRVHPAYNMDEYALFAELGEVAYAAYCKRRALEWIVDHPARFARLTAERAQRFWLGPRPWEPELLVIGERVERTGQAWVRWATHFVLGVLAIAGLFRRGWRPERVALLRWSFVLFPLVYYVTHVYERYRFPIEPLVVIAAAAAIARRRDDD